MLSMIEQKLHEKLNKLNSNVEQITNKSTFGFIFHVR